VAHDGSEEYSHTSEGLVVILADSLIGGNVASYLTEAIELAVEAVTFVPLDEIIIPVEYSGDLSLKYDSFSTVGCRTELFETQEIVDSSAAGKQLTIRLAGSSAMAAGRGPVLKLYFSHLVPAAYDQQTLIAFDGYAEFEPRFSGSYADYVPGTESGSITYIPCCQGVRGNANGDPDGKVNISDVSYLLAYMFGIPSGPPPPCPQEGNANGDPDEKTNISDVSYLLAYLFGIPSGPPPPSCPTSIVSVLEIPYGSSVVVDGNIVSDEWGDAAVRQFQVGSLIVVTVMAKHDGANLLVAYNYQFVQQEYLCVPEVLIDTENDKSENWMSDDWWFHVSATDCDANGTYNVWNGCSVVQPDWEGVPNFEMVPEPPRLDTFEVRIPFTKIGVTVGDTIGLALRAECVSSIYGYWPAGATIESPATWSIGILKP
ncbi:MAG: hypothetical protein OEW00_14270, partial [candidate division Zixibacteria bacterium]|nr:hypothetical protein [candidate division Zixibacteria bacterium]